MHRRLALAVSLSFILLVPGATASPPAPTLTGTQAGPVTVLQWSAPSGAQPLYWTLYRLSSDTTYERTYDLLPGTTFADHMPPPGVSFTYYVTYTTLGGEQSEASDPYRRYTPDCDVKSASCLLAMLCVIAGPAGDPVGDTCRDLRDHLSTGPICVGNTCVT